MENVLNVAEKNDVAKNVSSILSDGRSVRREGFSKFNKIYEFTASLHGRQCNMTMTSVSGHLLTHAFSGIYKIWKSCSPVELFEAPLSKVCIDNMENIKMTLEKEVRNCTKLIIWTDCDREGENIGYEIIDVCRAINPSITILRAKFSEITPRSIGTALQNVGAPDKLKSDAVNVRSELDLRIGAAFTRFQTLRLQQVFPQVLGTTVISYGSCQFPTLGFVVERYRAIQNFLQESFWKIKATHEYLSTVVEFAWKRDKIFNELACQVIYERCQENPTATVKKVLTKEKSKWRPVPLDTVELEKMASRKLRLSAKETMRIAEKLYTGGYISYPRTETNIFPKDLNLVPLIEMQTPHNEWGEFASKVLQDGPHPRRGKKTDEAHPPIHPTKYAHNLQGANEQRVYEFIVRHFLACVSKDAKGFETIVEIDINDEMFTASGLVILERNYLEVYPYDRWSDKEIPNYEINQTFEPTTVEMVSGETSPPSLLTEADLIALMEKHGIGTDATHAEHIETIKARAYVGLDGNKFVPGTLGMGLVEGYDSMGFDMSKPFLRAGLEADLQNICDGKKNPQLVLQTQIRNYKNIFEAAFQQSQKIDDALAVLFNQPAVNVDQIFANSTQNMTKMRNCPKCGSKIVAQNTNGKWRLSCQGFPDCKETLWFPKAVQDIKVSDEICMQCSGFPKKIEFTFIPRSFAPFLPNHYTGCVGGCDSVLMETVNIKQFPTRTRPVLSTENIRPTNQSSINIGSANQFSTNTRPINQALMNTRPSNQGSMNTRPSNQASMNIIPTNQVSRNTRPKNQSRGQGSHIVPEPVPSQVVRTPNRQVANDEINIQCNCGIPAFLLTVKKDGNNKGRQFYKCGELTSNCSFFKWTDEISENVDENTVRCICGTEARSLTVQKEGPNKGRQFLTCKKARGEQCGFFEWEDADEEMPASENTSRINQFRSQENPFAKQVAPSQTNTFTSRGPANNFSQTQDRNNSFPRASSNNTFSEEIPPNSFQQSDENNARCNCGTEVKRLTVLKEGPNKGRQFFTCIKARGEQCGFFEWDDADNRSRSNNDGSANNNSNNIKKAPRSGTRKCGICGEVGHNRRNCSQK